MKYAVISFEPIIDIRLQPNTLRVLCYIALTSDHAMTYNQIADELHINPRGIKIHVHRLVELGYIAELKAGFFKGKDDCPAIEKLRTFVILCGGCAS